MFCSSLRKRKHWTSAPNALLRIHWRETRLDTHDVAFPSTSQGDPKTVFRLLLVSTADGELDETMQRIESLSILNGGAHIAVVLLLAGEDAMPAFAHLQMGILSRGIEVPIIPVMSASDIVGCLDNLRKQCVERSLTSAQSTASQRDLVSHCVNGQPLSERQTNMVLDSGSGFKDLTCDAFDPEGQRLFRDLLGNADGTRLISFLKDGPLSANY